MSGALKIRLDRSLDIEWLDAIAALVANNADEHHIGSSLIEMLSATLSGGGKHGTACYKTAKVLFRSWVGVPRELEGFRNRASKVFPTLEADERLALHWAMLLANYQFFGDVTKHTGRLLALQGNCSLSQITRRMQETWGDRSTVTRATQRLLRSIVQWGVLRDTDRRGVYVQASEQVAVPEKLATLLLEALLRHERRPLPIHQLDRQPTVFPFRFRLGTHQIQESQQFELFLQGLDTELVALAPSRN